MISLEIALTLKSKAKAADSHGPAADPRLSNLRLVLLLLVQSDNEDQD